MLNFKPILLVHGHKVHGFSFSAVHLREGPKSSCCGCAAARCLRLLRTDTGDERAEPLLEPSPFGAGLLSPFTQKCLEGLRKELLVGLLVILGDSGFHLVQGINTPASPVGGGRVVGTEWKEWMGRVRNWVEVWFSVMVSFLGLHQIAA